TGSPRVPRVALVSPECRRPCSPRLDSRTGADSSALLPPRPSARLPCPSTKAGRRGSEEAVAQLRYLVGPFLSLGKLDCLHHPRVASFQPGGNWGTAAKPKAEEPCHGSVQSNG